MLPIPKVVRGPGTWNPIAPAIRDRLNRLNDLEALRAADLDPLDGHNAILRELKLPTMDEMMDKGMGDE